MKIGIIGAMDEELEILLKEMQLDRVENKANMSFKSGKIHDKDVVIVRSGIGKVNAAVCTQILVDDFNVDRVINVGIAGGIGKEIYPGDVVVADSLVQHDVDASGFGYKLGQIPRLDTLEFKCDEMLVDKAFSASKSLKEIKSFVGRIATGDQFICSTEKIVFLNDEFSAIACEMEGGSIAQVCYLNNIPFVVIRSISDNGNNDAHMDYEKFEKIAIKNSTEILKNMLINM